MIINKSKPVVYALTLSSFFVGGYVYAQGVYLENKSGQEIYHLHITDTFSDNITQKINDVNAHEINLKNTKGAYFSFENKKGILMYKNHLHGIEAIKYINQPSKYISLNGANAFDTKISVTQYNNGEFSGTCEGPGCGEINLYS